LEIPFHFIWFIFLLKVARTFVHPAYGITSRAKENLTASIRFITISNNDTK